MRAKRADGEEQLRQLFIRHTGLRQHGGGHLDLAGFGVEERRQAAVDDTAFLIHHAVFTGAFIAKMFGVAGDQRQAEVRQLARSALKIFPHSQPPPFPPVRTKKPYAALHTVRDSTRWLFSKFQGQYIKRARKFQQPLAARIYRPTPCSSSAPSRDERSVETKAVPRITAPPASSRSVGNSPMRSAAEAMP